jgi:DNA-directed RNA polymerase subunit L
MPLKVLNHKKDKFSFVVTNTDVSIINAIRRTIIGNIKVVVLAKQDCNITVNTSRFNNEILKQRLACIPICLTPDETSISHYKLELRESNTTAGVLHVTSKDFVVTEQGKPSKNQLFLPDPISGSYIDILRLRPKMGSVVESIELTATLSITTGNQTGTANIGNCYYRCSVNQEEAESEWAKKGSTNVHEKKDWDLLQAKRYVIPNSFEVTVESYVPSIYKPAQLVQIACLTLKKELLSFAEPLTIRESQTNMDNCVDIILHDCDYTIGKILEYHLYTIHFKTTINYISFLKNHPHDKDGILRINYFTNQTEEFITNMFLDACKECINYFNFDSDLKSM